MKNCAMPEAALSIWCGREVKNQTVLFRTAFEVPSGTALMTVLAGADSDFILYLDGLEVSRGQYPSYPGTRALNRLELPLPEAGRHQLTAIVWHSGENFHTGIAMPAGFSGSYLQSPRQPHSSARAGTICFLRETTPLRNTRSSSMLLILKA